MLITSRALRIAALGLAVVGFSASSVPAFVQADPQAQPDNTKQNKEARSKDAMTADQQKETAADRDLAKKIRRSIASDSSLSTYAHNIKVIAKASQIAGADKVQNELVVKS
jgi:hyperosmotically inducible protein